MGQVSDLDFDESLYVFNENSVLVFALNFTCPSTHRQS